MELIIKHPNSSESILLFIDLSEDLDEILYKISFADKRLSTTYGTVILKRTQNNFWKFPDKIDNFLMLLISETIFQLMLN